MQQNTSPERGSLEFLETYPSGSETIILPSGKSVEVKKYFLKFKKWNGNPIANTYGGKAVIDFNGEPLFAELAVLKLFQENGWDGVWVDSYRKKYRIGLPDVTEAVSIPNDKQKLIDELRIKTGKFGGCWDLFVWKGSELVFVELKRKKEDRIQESQRQWLQVSIESELSTSNFLFIEWILE